MRWIATPEKDTATVTLEKRLWDAADQFRANSGLKAQEYSGPILGLIFLRFAEVRFAAQRAKLEKAGASSRRGSRVDEPAAYHAEGILYLAPEARFDYLLTPARGRRHRRQGQRGDARHREAQPAARRRAAQDLQPLHQHAAQGAAQEGLRDPGQRGLRRLRPHLRVLPRRVRPHRGPEGRRVLHAEQHRPAARRGHRALPRPHPRPRLRLRRHVRAVGALRRRAPEEPRRRARHLRRREDRRDRPPVPPEPRRARPGRRHPPRRQRQQLLRRPAQRHRPVRLRPRQSAVQRQRGGQGAAQGHGRPRPPLPLRPAAHRQRQLPLDSALLLGAERQGPRRLRHGQLRLRRPRPPSRRSGRS